MADFVNAGTGTYQVTRGVCHSNERKSDWASGPKAPILVGMTYEDLNLMYGGLLFVAVGATFLLNREELARVEKRFWRLTGVEFDDPDTLTRKTTASAGLVSLTVGPVLLALAFLQ